MITAVVTQPPAWIAADRWSRDAWAAGWAHLRWRLIAANPAPECSHSWEECASGCPASAAWSTTIDTKIAELAAVAARAIEWSQGNGAVRGVGTRSAWINSAIRAVNDLTI